MPGMQLKECAHVTATAMCHEASGAKQRVPSALGLKQVACAGCQRQRRANKKLIKLLLVVFSTVA